MTLINDINQPHLVDEGRTAMIRIEFAAGFASRQNVEATVAIACRTYRELTVGVWQPDCVHFRHAASTNIATHRQVFRCPIEFESEFDGIACTTASLDLPNPLADTAMAENAQRLISTLLQQRPANSVTEQARQAIFLLISSGNATMEKVAENLAIHPRSLQRFLDREDTNFGKLLSGAKRELAVRYLNGSRQSVTDIGLLLGYSSTSSFSRWFTEEFGKSPATWRKAPPLEILAAISAQAA